jgi:hypothetical protein
MGKRFTCEYLIEKGHFERFEELFFCWKVVNLLIDFQFSRRTGKVIIWLISAIYSKVNGKLFHIGQTNFPIMIHFFFQPFHQAIPCGRQYAKAVDMAYMWRVLFTAIHKRHIFGSNKRFLSSKRCVLGSKWRADMFTPFENWKF